LDGCFETDFKGKPHWLRELERDDQDEGIKGKGEQIYREERDVR